MKYDFKCTECNNIFEIEMKISEYDKEKDNIKCPKCNNKANRVYNVSGIKTNDGFKKGLT